MRAGVGHLAAGPVACCLGAGAVDATRMLAIDSRPLPAGLVGMPSFPASRVGKAVVELAAGTRRDSTARLGPEELHR